MQNTTFENVETRIDAVFGSEGGGLVIADDTEGAEVDVYTYEYDYSEVYSYTRDLTFAVAPAPDAEAIADLAASRIPLPRATDPWFVALQAVRPLPSAKQCGTFTLTERRLWLGRPSARQHR